MKTQNIAALLMDGLKTIGVKFPDSNKIYTYKTLDNYEVGDYAIVCAHNTVLKIVDVAEVHTVPQIDPESSLKFQWIVQRIDFDNYKKLQEREDEFNNHLLILQQKTVKANAKALLSEALGLDSNEVEKLAGGLNE